MRRAYRRRELSTWWPAGTALRGNETDRRTRFNSWPISPLPGGDIHLSKKSMATETFTVAVSRACSRLNVWGQSISTHQRLQHRHRQAVRGRYLFHCRIYFAASGPAVCFLFDCSSSGTGFVVYFKRHIYTRKTICITSVGEHVCPPPGHISTYYLYRPLILKVYGRTPNGRVDMAVQRWPCQRVLLYDVRRGKMYWHSHITIAKSHQIHWASLF